MHSTIVVVEEARLLKKLRHPNIINCYGYHIYENALHIVMHYAEGGTLQDLISDQCGKYLPGTRCKDSKFNTMVACL